MVGHGFMGAAHSVGWRQAPRQFELPQDVEMSVLVGRQLPATKASAEKWGWQECSTDWRSVIERDDIDIVDIVTPSETHAEIAIAALAAGKHVLCEKPLANTLDEANAMAAAAAEAARAGVRTMVGFTYRRVPAIALMREQIAQGAIGRVQQVRASYRQDWLVDPEAPLTWRLKKELAGSGALGDIGAHAIDLAQFVTGSEILHVSGVIDTIVSRRPVTRATLADPRPELGEVTVDDIALFTGRFANDALGSFEATRFATGRKNELSIEVSGDAGALAFNLEDLNSLNYYDRSAPTRLQGFVKILVTEPDHPYLEGWWPAGHMLGYEHGFAHQVKDLVEAISDKRPTHPSFSEGLRVQQVLDAVQRSAGRGAVWTAVRDPTGNGTGSTPLIPSEPQRRADHARSRNH
ncbi:MAG TPA: Gfo/Idh/MocA family oxidoreductase [Microbacterium sp.]|uniref:Gfo/Idh/MocA family protein n=1 Tax=Microbacterium sp. TaxID=51671 RepID=UPI002C8C17CA|nr:Gfo/Idh/MocA family oxidoreductase [Microbacterium sp.]HWI30751.1 Gfo/Idh/MocA family oxidoreductase [Microbacterium sp.]